MRQILGRNDSGVSGLLREKWLADAVSRRAAWVIGSRTRRKGGFAAETPMKYAGANWEYSFAPARCALRLVVAVSVSRVIGLGS